MADKVKTEKEEQTKNKNNKAKSPKSKHTGSSEGNQTKKAVNKEKKYAKELQKCEEKNHELQDKYLRLSAEFDNYRKRTLKEKADLTKFASAEVIRNILPVVDDFERSMQNIEQAKDINAVKEGIKLIYNKFGDFLKQNAVKEIDAMHQEFNFDIHEAVTKIPAPDEELKGKIVDVIEKGYMLNDRVLRFSKVVVGE